AALFFFQAEDGIRDFHVTGVQTCALPISDRHLRVGAQVMSTLRALDAPLSQPIRRPPPEFAVSADKPPFTASGFPAGWAYAAGAAMGAGTRALLPSPHAVYITMKDF